MLKLKLQHFGYLIQRLIHWKRHWYWERLRAGGEGGGRGWNGQMASLTQWTGVWTNSDSQWRTGKPACCSPWGFTSFQPGLPSVLISNFLPNSGHLNCFQSFALTNSAPGHNFVYSSVYKSARSRAAEPKVKCICILINTQWVSSSHEVAKDFPLFNWVKTCLTRK